MDCTVPEQIDFVLAEAMHRHDVDAIVDLYEPNATYIAGPDAKPVVGHPAIRSAFAAFLNGDVSITMAPRLVASDGDIAVVYNEWRGRFQRAGEAPVDTEGKAVEVLRKQQDGSWKYLFDDARARG